MLTTLSAVLLAAASSTAPQDSLRIGTLEFKRCELGQRHTAATTEAFCAPFTVPENWDAPDGRKINLKLAIVKSDASAPQPDPVVLLAGGPGQAATEAYPQVASALAPLKKQRHIVLMDQRGTGGSNKLECRDESPEDQALAQEISPERIRTETQACVEKLKDKADPRYYSTTDAARDLEALRQALGGVQYNLLGISYGTRMGQQYLKRFPAGVRSLIIDSVAPNEMILGQNFAADLDAALKARFALCNKDKECAERFGDVYATLYRVRDQLAAQPQKLSIRDPYNFTAEERSLSAEGFSSIVRMYAYSPLTAAMLPLGISETGKGNLAPLLGQIRLLTGDMRESITTGMELSVICAEDADLLHEDPASAKLILGNDFIQAIKLQCDNWPHGKRPDDFHEPLKSDTPVLALSGEFDPVTPARYGDQVIKGATHGRHLVAPGQGHNVIGVGCMPKLVKEFVEKLQPDKIDAGCLADLGITPYFLDFNGAAP